MTTSYKPRAICLVSGGLDSCVTAAIADETCRLAFLHVNYGQRTEKRELEAFRAIADHYRVQERFEASISYLREIGGSALTDRRIAVPPGNPAREGIPATYVPFRNTHLIAIAVSWAEVLGARFIYIGATEMDSSGYPDCRATYFHAYNRLIEEGTKPGTSIRIVTPLLHLDKAGVVREGIKRAAPLHLTWSCYAQEDEACGRCDSCLLRLKGFREAGVEDPVPYSTKTSTNPLGVEDPVPYSTRT